MTLIALLQIVLTLINLAVCGFAAKFLLAKIGHLFKTQVIVMVAVVFFVLEILILKVL